MALTLRWVAFGITVHGNGNNSSAEFFTVVYRTPNTPFYLGKKTAAAWLRKSLFREFHYYLGFCVLVKTKNWKNEQALRLELMMASSRSAITIELIVFEESTNTLYPVNLQVLERLSGSIQNNQFLSSYDSHPSCIKRTCTCISWRYPCPDVTLRCCSIVLHLTKGIL